MGLADVGARELPGCGLEARALRLGSLLSPMGPGGCSPVGARTVPVADPASPRRGGADPGRDRVGAPGDGGGLADEGRALAVERGGSTPRPTLLGALGKVLGVRARTFLEEDSALVEWLAFRERAPVPKRRQEPVRVRAEALLETHLRLRDAFEPEPARIRRSAPGSATPREPRRRRRRCDAREGSGRLRSPA